ADRASGARLDQDEVALLQNSFVLPLTAASRPGVTHLADQGDPQRSRGPVTLLGPKIMGLDEAGFRRALESLRAEREEEEGLQDCTLTHGLAADAERAEPALHGTDARFPRRGERAQLIDMLLHRERAIEITAPDAEREQPLELSEGVPPIRDLEVEESEEVALRDVVGIRVDD